jgi:hypothetical protein
MYPAAVLVGLESSISYLNKSLYTRAFHLRVRYLWFRDSSDADGCGYSLWCYGTKNKITCYQYPFGGLVGAFNFNILFYLKAHQAFADNPSTVSQQWIWVLLFWEFIEFSFLKKKDKRNYMGLDIVLIALSQIYV